MLITEGYPWSKEGGEDLQVSVGVQAVIQISEGMVCTVIRAKTTAPCCKVASLYTYNMIPSCVYIHM